MTERPDLGKTLAQRLEDLTSKVGTHGCDDLTVRLARYGIVEGDVGFPANLPNVAALLPNLFVRVTVNGKQKLTLDPRLDVDGTTGPTENDLISAVMAAALKAKQANVTPDKVVVDEGFVTLAMQACAQVQSTSCKPEKNPPKIPTR